MQKFITILDPGSQTVRWRERGKTLSEASILFQTAIGIKARVLSHRSSEMLKLECPLQNDEVPTVVSVEFLKLLRRRMSNKVFCIVIPDWFPPEDEPALRKIYRAGGFNTLRLTHEMEAIRSIDREAGCLYLHLGAQRTLLAFFEGRDLKSYRSIRWGGNNLDEGVQRFLLRNKKLTIGSWTARLLKDSFGRRRSCKILARDPERWHNIELNLSTLYVSFNDELAVLLRNIQPMLQKLPQVKCLKLSGGLANFAPLPEFLNKTLNLPVQRLPDPENAVLNGLEKLL